MSTTIAKPHEISSSVLGLGIRTTEFTEAILKTVRYSVYNSEPISFKNLENNLPNSRKHEIEASVINQMTVTLLTLYGIKEPKDILADDTYERIAQTVRKLTPSSADIIKFEIQKQILIEAVAGVEDLYKDYTLERPREEMYNHIAEATLLLGKKTVEFLRNA